MAFHANHKFLGVTALLCSLLLGCQDPAIENVDLDTAIPNPPSDLSAELEVVEKPHNLWFHAPSAKGWSKGKPRTIRSGDGYIVDYFSENGVSLTISVYQPGAESVPEDLSDKKVSQEFAAAKDSIKQAELLGVYEDVEQLKEGKTRIDKQKGPVALWAKYSLIKGENHSTSDLLLTVVNNHFVKIRFSREALSEEDADMKKSVRNSLSELLSAIGHQLALPPGTKAPSETDLDPALEVDKLIDSLQQDPADTITPDSPKPDSPVQP